MTRFDRALAGEPQAVPPIWLMRQAGRYHRHYQALRRQHSFDALCRTPELAAEVARGPVEAFDFDSAILFSDLLYPLDALGLRVRYTDAGPQLDARLTPASLARLRSLDDAAARLTFQSEAVAATRAVIPTDRGLIGFVGGPWTLFVYAVEGSHSGSLTTAKTSLPLYRRFTRRLVPLLSRAIAGQLAAGADVVMIFDTAAGELPAREFADHVAPDLAALANAFPNRLGYYAKNLHPTHLAPGPLVDAPWAGFGFDWRWDLASRLRARRAGFVQGNFDPSLLFLRGRALDRAVTAFLAPVAALSPAERRGWICGLGHGVLPGTPESSVRRFVQLVRRTLR